MNSLTKSVSVVVDLYNLYSYHYANHGYVLFFFFFRKYVKNDCSFSCCTDLHLYHETSTIRGRQKNNKSNLLLENVFKTRYIRGIYEKTKPHTHLQLIGTTKTVFKDQKSCFQTNASQELSIIMRVKLLT